MARVRVGIVGVNPERGWALSAHLPALRASSDFEISAVSSTRLESAREAADMFNVPKAFDNHFELVNQPDIDLVTVTVKVPHHHEIVMAALESGKHVYCEWPLGNGLREAEQMSALASKNKLHGFVGLQGRMAPVINQVRKLINEGYVGEVLSTSVVASGRGWGQSVMSASMYLLDEANGATMLTIPAGHFIDSLRYCLGAFESVSAIGSTRRKSVFVEGTSETCAMKTADQIVVSGTLRGGAVASIHFRGGTNRSTNLLWEINGTEGDLLVTGASGHVQMIDLALSGARGGEKQMQPIEVAPDFFWAPPDTPVGSPYNVAQLYGQIAKTFKEGTSTAPTFEDAVTLHSTLDTIQKSMAQNHSRAVPSPTAAQARNRNP